jgi:L-ascorbate metabolism protein UlaG (beta-lactamase superfamily)
MVACASGPGSLKKLTKNNIAYQAQDSVINIAGGTDTLTVQYTGAGGLVFQKGSSAIMIDPFFSNQRVMRIGSSLFGRSHSGKRKLSSDPDMIAVGLQRVTNHIGSLENIKTILSAHSHYDHLMDVPAIFEKLRKRPAVYISKSGYNTCYNVIDTTHMHVLENHMTTQEVSRPPILVDIPNGKIHIYPILADHNPHFKYVKFFSGSKTSPVKDFTDPYGRSRANDWLEGRVFSFLIDYMDKAGRIQFRIFIQSSSCNPPAGIPPASLLKGRPVDVAFLGLVSFQFSTEYPCALLEAVQPKKVVWIHWEDFFRKYTKKPKTVRGTDVVKFSDLPCVQGYKSKSLLPVPGVAFELH